MRRHMESQQQLVHLEKRVIANEAGGGDLQAQFFAHLAQDGVVRGFVPLQKTGDQPIHFLRPAPVAGQNDRAVQFDDGGDHRYWVVPMHIAAVGGVAALSGTAVDGDGLQGVAALRAKLTDIANRPVAWRAASIRQKSTSDL